MQTKPPAGSRLEFLDCARGVAALAVALTHTFSLWSPRFFRFVLDSFNPGVFGVMTFFLVSGFVIPFSLERLGSLRKFWINRFFRLFPLYWASLAAVLVLYRLHLAGPPSDFVAALPASALWNVTMVHHLFFQPSAIGLYWTLSYEMLFYLCMSGLFLFGWNQRTLLILLAGTGAYAVADIIQPLMDHEVHFHIPQFWMLTFCAGTAIYRGWSGSARPAAVSGALVALGVVVGAAAFVNFAYIGWTPTGPNADIQVRPAAFLSGWCAAYAFFGLLFWLRGARFPRVASWLGRISYSVYLGHGLILLIALPGSPTRLLVTRLVATIALATLTYRFIEKPMLEMGKSLTLHRLGSPATSRPSG